MKRILTTLFLLSLACSAINAQEPLAAFSSVTRENAVTFEYSYALQGDIPVKGAGSAAIDGDAYRITTGELEIVCDGKTRWMVDGDSKEVYIESVDAAAVDYLSNPAALLCSLTDAFSVTKSGKVSQDGKSLTRVCMVPAKKGTGLSEVTLYLDGSVPSRVDVTLEEGAKTVFRINNWRVKEKGGMTFAVDSARIDASYVITDLR